MGKLFQDVSERLRAQGGRMTSQRRLICEALESLSGHPTADELFELVRQRDPSLNLSTVYRTLRWLEQEGLVSARRFDGEERQDRFDPGIPSEHHHFLCTKCRRVIEFSDPSINQVQMEFELSHDVSIESASVVFYGLCRHCRA